MPNIREFDTGQIGLQPTEVGVEATAAAARRSGAFFHEAAQDLTTLGQRFGAAIRDAGDAAVKYLEHREISQGAANFTALQDAKTKEWNTTAKDADPNDPSIAARFREESLDPSLDKFKSTFMTEGGQRWAEHHVDALRQHMFLKTSADMSRLAADAIHTNVLKTINNLGSTVYNDPSSLDFARETLRSSIEGMVQSSPTLTPVDAAKAKNDLLLHGEEHLVRSAVMSAIAKGADWQSIASNPKNKDYIKPAEMEQFARAAKAQERADLLTTKQIEQFRRQQEAEASHEVLSKLWTDSVSFDENGRATIKPNFYRDALDVERAHPGAATERVRAFINWGQAQQREKREIVVTDPVVHQQLYDGLFDPNKPTSDVDILNAAAQNKINSHDTSMLLHLSQALQDQLPKDPIFRAKMDAVKEHVGLTIMPDGHDRYASFLQSFLPEYLKLKRAGALPDNALNMNDSQSLIRKWSDQFAPDPKERLKWRMMKALGNQSPDVLGTPAPSTLRGLPVPKVGDIQAGYRFKGGDPGKAESWEQVK